MTIALIVLFQLYKTNWMSGPYSVLNETRIKLCVKSTANFTIAKSPAFDIEGKLRNYIELSIFPTTQLIFISVTFVHNSYK